MSQESNETATTLSITVQKRSLVKGDSSVVKQVSLVQVAMTEAKATRLLHRSMDMPNGAAVDAKKGLETTIRQGQCLRTNMHTQRPPRVGLRVFSESRGQRIEDKGPISDDLRLAEASGSNRVKESRRILA